LAKIKGLEAFAKAVRIKQIESKNVADVLGVSLEPVAVL